MSTLLNQYRPIQTVACTMINCLALKLLFVDKHSKHRASDKAVSPAPPPAAQIPLGSGHPGLKQPQLSHSCHRVTSSPRPSDPPGARLGMPGWLLDHHGAEEL